MSAQVDTGTERPAPTLAYEHVPGTDAQVANLLDVLSVFVPDDQEDGGADPEG